MALDDSDMLLIDDFYSAGLAAAELVEKGHVDAAEDILRRNLDGVTDQKYQQTAQEILERLDNPSEDALESIQIKQLSLEFMLMDADTSQKKKDKFVERYSERSVKYLALARERPKFARGLEALGDIVEGIVFAGDSAIRGTAYGLLGPTGIRKFAEYAENSEVSENKALYTAMPFMFYSLLGAGLFVSVAATLQIQGNGEQVPLIWQAAMYFWAGSGAYELARLTKNAYARHSAKSLSSTSAEQLPEQTAVKARVELDLGDGIIENADGNEERLYVNELLLKKHVAGDPQ